MQSIIHFPALGRHAELRDALVQRNETANAAGSPHGLSESMFAPEPLLIQRIRFENLTTIEAYQQANRSDPTFQAQVGRITQCLSRPQATALYEELVITPLEAPPNFVLGIRLCPAAGRTGEMRGLIEERIKTPQPGLAAVGLAVQVASPDGFAFRVSLLFSSMAAIDEWRAAGAADPYTQKFLESIADASRTPPRQLMQRIIAPFPPAV